MRYDRATIRDDRDGNPVKVISQFRSPTMKVAFGLKAHSGWAALILLGVDDDQFEVIDRRRLELVEEDWAKQPYHAAEQLETKEARQVVKRGTSAAHLHARRAIRDAVKRVEKNAHSVVGCAVLMGASMPDWTVEQILAVHFRMHKAEGVLFREALVEAARHSKLKVVEVPEKTLDEFAVHSLGISSSKLAEQVSTLGKSIGAPWGKDQKEATVAAMIALKQLS